jgi:D-sedoheptulose 7-phosphate isomerase
MTVTNGPDPASVIRSRLKDNAAIKKAMWQDEIVIGTIAEIAATIVDSFRTGRKVLLCGNGGSASDANHIAAELVGRFVSDRAPLPAISLAANTSTVTAIGNDYAFEEIFSRQVHGLGRPGDVLIGLSTSGNSENVVRAVQVAKENGLTTVAFTGSGGGRLLEIADLGLQIPDENTARIQEAHITAAHIICELVEVELFGDKT